MYLSCPHENEHKWITKQSSELTRSRDAELPLINPLLADEVERLGDFRGGEHIPLRGNCCNVNQTQSMHNPVSQDFTPAERNRELGSTAGTCAEPVGGAARGPRRAAVGEEEQRVETAEAG